MKGFPYRAVFTLVELNFNADLNNPTSQGFVNLASNVVLSVSSAYKDSSVFLAVFVNGFSNGSVIADVTIILSKDLSSPLTELVDDANADGKIGNMTVEPSSIKLVDEANGVSSTSPPTKDDISAQSMEDVKNIIIGTLAFLVICFLVALIMIVVSIWYVCVSRVITAVEVREIPSEIFNDELTTPTYHHRGIMEEYY